MASSGKSFHISFIKKLFVKTLRIVLGSGRPCPCQNWLLWVEFWHNAWNLEKDLQSNPLWMSEKTHLIAVVLKKMLVKTFRIVPSSGRPYPEEFQLFWVKFLRDAWNPEQDLLSTLLWISLWKVSELFYVVSLSRRILTSLSYVFTWCVKSWKLFAVNFSLDFQINHPISVFIKKIFLKTLRISRGHPCPAEC